VGVYWGGVLKITKKNGATLTPTITVGYRRFELSDDPKLVDVATNLTPGSRMAPTQVHNEWRVEFPWDDVSLPEAILLFASGNILDFEWQANPGATAGSEKKYLLSNTCVGAGRRTSGTDDANRFERSGAGGDLTTPAGP
jgi:hypothetical protein